MTTLRQLRFLVALDETQNFSRASELCHVTQSTLSTGLKELEERLGVRVAERTKQSVLMTQVGRDLAARARTILAEVQDFENRAQREQVAGATVVRLGTIPTVGPFLMPRTMPMLRRRFANTKFYLREELTDQLVEGLLEGRLDLLLIALPHPLPPQIETDVLFSDGYWLATPPDHPLGNYETVGANDLVDRQLLLLEKGHCLQRHALSSFSGINLDEDQSFSATSLSTLLAMVEEDLGMTLLPKLAVDAGITKGHMLHLGHVDGASPRQVALAWRRSSPSRALFKKIGAILKEARADLEKVATSD
ncbi:LysR substrate-binding domain-containing protein [Hoeflea prorocentri]|uniref:LysR substrate-binding domain-containing protein n=1 Tax=Hoeflea prorocentri TaxID=1922333 RepID=A0A9X3UMS1_9HYPH|nr:LysR substrate-binding domain-containing protein [Hoeflea prorocentri]MCY6383725.1 LysR substrate-binding domain-containing protein [Hoeflea prorocentri]MDA5401525.1 LysR substrate-binding domain-containing protein [Hoeflea prorocentri]